MDPGAGCIVSIEDAGPAVVLATERQRGEAGPSSSVRLEATGKHTVSLSITPTARSVPKSGLYRTGKLRIEPFGGLVLNDSDGPVERALHIDLSPMLRP